MKILWVNPNFLHPTTKGGQIRTLEMLRELHKRHEIHYVAFYGEPEGSEKAPEYSAKAYAIPHYLPRRGSLGFGLQLLGSVFDPLPLAVARYRSKQKRRMLKELAAEERFDVVVCDFLFSGPNMPDLSRCVLFEHNVETTIWERQRDNARPLLKRWYLGRQAAKMLAYETEACRTARQVVAVSETDAERLRRMGANRVSTVKTGVNTHFFAPPAAPDPVADLVFLGSMDWTPNIDGVLFFVRETLPLIRRKRPDCSVAVAGRRPAPEIVALAAKDPGILVTGTVPDVRPYLWGSKVSIVPLRIGGGTRLKIYESMAARTPVVSTSVGAEGLLVHPPDDIRIADSPGEFAEQCLELLEDDAARQRQAAAAWSMVDEQFSWAQVTEEFERTLQACAEP